MFKKLTLLFIFCLSTSILFSQNFAWAKTFGGVNYEEANFVITDATGNVYTTGYFQGTVDFDPSASVYSLTATSPTNLFISKLDPFGNFLWAKSVGASNVAIGEALAIDNSGDLIVSGIFAGTGDFDPGPANFSLTSTGGTGDIFILKLDASGNFIWVKQIGGTSADNLGSLSLDPGGNIFITGYCWGTCDFDPGPSVYNQTPVGNNDIYVAKYDNLGNFLWAKQMGGTATEEGSDIKIDASGNAYILGFFTSIGADFDPGVGTFTMSALSTDIFVSKLDGAGNFVWAKQMGGSGVNGLPRSLTLDASGNIYSTGAFNFPADFDPGPGTFSLLPGGMFDAFVSKLDNNGNFIWAKKIGGSGDEYGTSMRIDGYGDVLIAGHFIGTSTDFDPGPGTFTMTSPGGNMQIFIEKLDNAGNFIWAKNMGGTDHDVPYSLAIDYQNNVLTAGYFRFSGDYDPGPSVFTLNAVGNEDIFVHKLCTVPLAPINTTSVSGLTGCSNPASTLTASGLGIMNWYSSSTSTLILSSGPSFTTPPLAAGVYTFYVGASTSCTVSSSRTPITVTINPSPTLSVISSASIICPGQTVTLSASGAPTYSWSTGSNASTISVSLSVTNTFTVAGTNTIGCIGVAMITQSVAVCASMTEQNSEKLKPIFFPNPNNGIFTIQIEEELQVTITDMIGRIIYSEQLNRGTYTFSNTEISSGIYFLKVDNEEFTQTIKFLKE